MSSTIRTQTSQKLPMPGHEGHSGVCTPGGSQPLEERNNYFQTTAKGGVPDQRQHHSEHCQCQCSEYLQAERAEYHDVTLHSLSYRPLIPISQSCHKGTKIGIGT